MIQAYQGRSLNDWIWYGSALEGTVRAKALELPSSVNSNSNSNSNLTRLSEGLPSHHHGAWPSWDALRSRGFESEARGLLSEARACYRKKGGCPSMVVEQSVVLAKMVAGNDQSELSNGE